MNAVEINVKAAELTAMLHDAAAKLPFAQRHDIEMRVLWRTIGQLSFYADEGTPAEKKFALRLLAQMIEDTQEFSRDLPNTHST